MPNTFAEIFRRNTMAAAEAAFADPGRIQEQEDGTGVTAWTLLLGSMQLRENGDRSAANEWLNYAMRVSPGNDVFQAELLGEAGQGLFDSDRLQDAFDILSSAMSYWRDICDEASRALSGQDAAAASALAANLDPILAAAGRTRPANARSDEALVHQWYHQRASVARSRAADKFVRLLAKVGGEDDGEKLCNEEIAWLNDSFGSVSGRPVREALYLLTLARGEVELARDAFEDSARTFREAADIFEGRVEDENDINRLLRAKFNEANSLLRLHRIDEAMDIYALCEHGFRSIGQEDSAQRVAHAKLFARTMEEDDVD